MTNAEILNYLSDLPHHTRQATYRMTEQTSPMCTAEFIAADLKFARSRTDDDAYQLAAYAFASVLPDALARCIPDHVSRITAYLA